MLLNSKTDVEKMEHVDIIASGYEWDCPNCEHLNLVIEVTDVVECDECHFLYATNPAEHAVGTRKAARACPPHLHVKIHTKLYARQTHDMPAEYTQKAECLDCGEWLDVEDIPEQAEVKS